MGLGALAGAGASSTLGFGQRAGAAEITAPRELILHNLHTDEKLQALYWDKGSYVPDALAAIRKVLRDHRDNVEHDIDPRLLDLLAALGPKLESKNAYQVICGYRSPQTNAMLHARSSQVANNSLHMKGMATDVRIDGVQLSHLHKAALSLQGGGVGLYPRSNFVHLDCGPVRTWSGT